MEWRISHRFDPAACAIADRHYNRQKIGTPQFVPPGRCLVLLAPGPALWVTSWPFAEFTQHAWAGAWVCSAFRREGGAQASLMIREAVAATIAYFGAPPPLGMITFIDRRQVPPLHTRTGDMWGYTYRRAGFVDAGETKGGLLALQLWPNAMPASEAALQSQGRLFA